MVISERFYDRRGIADLMYGLEEFRPTRTMESDEDIENLFSPPRVDEDDKEITWEEKVQYAFDEWLDCLGFLRGEVGITRVILEAILRLTKFTLGLYPAILVIYMLFN